MDMTLQELGMLLAMALVLLFFWAIGWDGIGRLLAGLYRRFIDRGDYVAPGQNREAKPDTRTSASEPEPNQRIADTDAENASTQEDTSKELVRLSRGLKTADFVVLMASAKDEKGKYLFSANAIAAAVGGTRKTVLDQVAAIRKASNGYPASKSTGKIQVNVAGESYTLDK